MSRKYMSHRKAYAPRLWPMAVASAAVIGVATWLVPITNPWVGIGLGVLAGFVFGHLRWVIWRKRHPVISTDEYINEMRRNAPWN